jgi:uncharacterized protein
MPYLTVGPGLHVFHNAWVAILAYHAGIVLILWIARFKNSASFRITLPIWKLLAFAAVGCIAGLSMSSLWPYVFTSANLAGTLERWGLTSASWPWFIAYSALVNPWLEELYWRGWLGSGTRFPVPNDAAFAGFHLVILAPFISLAWLIVVFITLTIAGWLWRRVTSRTNSLLPSAVCHLVADVSILIAIVSEIT